MLVAASRDGHSSRSDQRGAARIRGRAGRGGVLRACGRTARIGGERERESAFHSAPALRQSAHVDDEWNGSGDWHGGRPLRERSPAR